MIYLAAIVFGSGLIGVVLCLHVLIILRNAVQFQNSFGSFTISAMISSTALLVLFSTGIVAEILSPDQVPHRLINIVSYLIMAFSFAFLYSICLMSFNRLFAVFLPFKYGHYFTIEEARKYLTVAWILPFLQSAVYLIDECHFEFKGDRMSFVFAKTSCGEWLSTLQDLVFNAGVGLFAMTVDIITVAKLISNYKRARLIGRRVTLSQFCKGELRQFAQAFISSTTYVGMLLCFHIGSRVETSGTLLFWLTTYAWELYYVVQAFVLILLYKELRTLNYKNARIQKKKSTTVTVIK